MWNVGESDAYRGHEERSVNGVAYILSSRVYVRISTSSATNGTTELIIAHACWHDRPTWKIPWQTSGVLRYTHYGPDHWRFCQPASVRRIRSAMTRERSATHLQGKVVTLSGCNSTAIRPGACDRPLAKTSLRYTALDSSRLGILQFETAWLRTNKIEDLLFSSEGTQKQISAAGWRGTRHGRVLSTSFSAGRRRLTTADGAAARARVRPVGPGDPRHISTVTSRVLPRPEHSERRNCGEVAHPVRPVNGAPADRRDSTVH